MDKEGTRPLTEAEAAALNFMLAADLPGFEQLREQAKTARVAGGCVCGCCSIDIVVDRDNTPPALDAWPGCAASAASKHDDRFTHLNLWVDGDYLSSLDLSWIEMMEEFPPPEAFDPPTRG